MGAFLIDEISRYSSDSGFLDADIGNTKGGGCKSLCYSLFLLSVFLSCEY